MEEGAGRAQHPGAVQGGAWGWRLWWFRVWPQRECLPVLDPRSGCRLSPCPLGLLLGSLIILHLEADLLILVMLANQIREEESQVCIPCTVVLRITNCCGFAFSFAVSSWKFSKSKIRIDFPLGTRETPWHNSWQSEFSLFFSIEKNLLTLKDCGHLILNTYYTGDLMDGLRD